MYPCVRIPFLKTCSAKKLTDRSAVVAPGASRVLGFALRDLGAEERVRALGLARALECGHAAQDSARPFRCRRGHPVIGDANAADVEGGILLDHDGHGGGGTDSDGPH